MSKRIATISYEKEITDIEYDNLIKFENNTILILKGDKLAALIMD